MKLIIIALALWAMKAWIENDPKQNPEAPIEEPLPLEAEEWYLYGV